MTETNEKLDPRIARTRSLLWATLVALIKKRGYAAISVQDITTHARVNRSTFYRHYEDKDDLFRQGCSDLYDAIFLRMQSLLEHTQESGARWVPEYFIQLFKLIDAESRTLQVIGGTNSNPDFRQITMDKIDVFVLEKRLRPFSAGSARPEIDDLYAAAVSSIITGLVTQWLHRPERFTIEEISEVYRDVISNGIKPYSTAS